jgi:predicted dehydrogenase
MASQIAHNRLRWGILGTGNIARQFAAGVIASERGEMAVVGSRDIASARSFAQQFNVAESFGSYQQVVESPDVDVVYVALPNSMHHHWTLAALAAGKHVLCEKPLASNPAEAQEMFDAATRAGRLLVEAFMYRSHPMTLAVVDAINAGAIGRLKLIRSSFCFRTRKIDGNIRFSAELAGGALMDIGCYCINFSRFFAGAEPSAMHVTGQLHSSGVDELAAGTLSFPDGVVASFTCGMTVQADNTAYLCGDEGYIEIPIPWKPPATSAEFTIARSTPPKMDSAGKLAPAAPPREKRLISAGQDLYAVEADDVAATILDGRVPRINAADSLGNMRVLDTLRRLLGVRLT